MSDVGFPEVGDVIDGRYEILGLLGMGGMGAVYKASFKQLGGRIVALKVLKPNMGEGAEFRKRFEREAQIAARLQHPCIVGVSDFGQLSNGLLYMALEYVEGDDLKKVLKKSRGGLPVARAVALTASILEALSVAHKAGVIHRDLKPQNIMVQSVGGRDQLKVLDFGIAKVQNEEALTMANQILGTVAYMSPEQTRAEPIDGRSDLYSVGIMLYEMLTGTVPFRGRTVVEIIKQHRKATPKNPSEIKSELPDALVAAVLRALEKDAALRFADALEFLKAIESSAIVPLGDAETVQGGAVSGTSRTNATAATIIATSPNTIASYSNLVGQTLDGKYEVKEKLGEGGMGAVYRAHNILLGLDVALKVMHPNHCQDVTFRERFVREVRAMSGFTHPNAITVREFVQSQSGFLYMTMDYCQGVALKDVIEQNNYLPVERSLNIASQILSALAEGHRKGIVHRDIKPDNVLIEDDHGADHVKVLDFGIAKILEGDSTEKDSLTGRHVIGTPSYMSPEQASGEPVDARTDLYAVGCVLYEMLSGAKVFVAETVMQTLMAQVTKTPTPVDQRCPQAKIPAQVSQMVNCALAKEPEQRFASAKAFIKCIDELQGSGLVQAGAASGGTSVTMMAEVIDDSIASISPNIEKKSSNILAIAGLGAAILVLAGIAGGFALDLDNKNNNSGKSDVALASLSANTGKTTAGKTPDKEGKTAPKAPVGVKKTAATAEPVRTSNPVTDAAGKKPLGSDKSVIKKTPAIKNVEQPKAPVAKKQPAPIAKNTEDNSKKLPAPELEKKAEKPLVVADPKPAEVQKTDAPELLPPPEVEANPAKKPLPLPPPIQATKPSNRTPEGLASEGKIVAIPKPVDKGRVRTRVSVAVLPFVIRRESVERDVRGLVWRLGKETETSVLTAVLTRKLVEAKKFDVVEREKVAAAIREQNFGLEGRMDPERTVAFGKVIGADFLILGEISKITVSRETIDSGRFAGRLRFSTLFTLSMEVEMRIINSRTTKIVSAKKVTGSTSTKVQGRLIKGLAAFASNRMEATREKLIGNIVRAIVDDVYPLKVIKVKKDGVFINRGQTSGIKVGDTFDVYRVGEPIVDEETGMVLGIDKKKIGQILVTSVDKSYAQATIVKGVVEKLGLCKKVAVRVRKARSKPARRRPWGNR
jgi:serine/threonine protein kinase/curli biogenesis system outer membrane secretion channel CsgG